MGGGRDESDGEDEGGGGERWLEQLLLQGEGEVTPGGRADRARGTHVLLLHGGGGGVIRG